MLVEVVANNIHIMNILPKQHMSLDASEPVHDLLPIIFVVRDSICKYPPKGNNFSRLVCVLTQ